MMDAKQQDFMQELATFRRKVELLPPFRGKTQVLNALRRIASLAVFQ